VKSAGERDIIHAIAQRHAKGYKIVDQLEITKLGCAALGPRGRMVAIDKGLALRACASAKMLSKNLGARGAP
jgi:hypothetical protein